MHVHAYGNALFVCFHAYIDLASMLCGIVSFDHSLDSFGRS